MFIGVNQEFADRIERCRDSTRAGGGRIGCRQRQGALPERQQALSLLQQALHIAGVHRKTLFDERERRFLLVRVECRDTAEEPAGGVRRPRRAAPGRRRRCPRKIAPVQPRTDFTLKVRKGGGAHDVE